jgi:hypothetical protein
MTLSITTFSIMMLSIRGIFMTLSINDTQHNKTAVMLSVIMLNVILPSVEILKVVAPISKAIMTKKNVL